MKWTFGVQNFVFMYLIWFFSLTPEIPLGPAPHCNCCHWSHSFVFLTFTLLTSSLKTLRPQSLDLSYFVSRLFVHSPVWLDGCWACGTQGLTAEWGCSSLISLRLPTCGELPGCQWHGPSWSECERRIQQWSPSCLITSLWVSGIPVGAPGPPGSSMAIWCFQPPLCLSGDVSSLLTAACSTPLLHFYHQGESFPIRPSPAIRGCPDGGPKRHEEWYLWAEVQVRSVRRGRWSS